MWSTVERDLASFPFELRERKRKALRDDEFQRFLIWREVIGHPYTEEEHRADEKKFIGEIEREFEEEPNNDQGDPKEDSDEGFVSKKQRRQTRKLRKPTKKGKCERQIAREQCALEGDLSDDADSDNYMRAKDD